MGSNISMFLCFSFFGDGISRALPEHPIPWDMYALDDIDSQSNSNYSKRKKKKRRKNNHRPPAFLLPLIYTARWYIYKKAAPPNPSPPPLL